MVNDIAVQEFVNALKESPTEPNTIYGAKVSRVDSNGVVWVNLFGSDKETPTASTSSEVKRGDTVTVQWRNNKLYIGGNYSNPSAGVIRVEQNEKNTQFALDEALRASEAADKAEAEAVRAGVAADRAEASAILANVAANDALTQLSVVEEVVETLNWISEHGTYKLSEDTEVAERKMYFLLQGTAVPTPTTLSDNTKLTNLESYYELVNGVYIKTQDTTYDPSKTYYTVTASYVTTPSGNPSENGYYEIFSIDEAVQNYISSHLALTDAGLWITKDNAGYKILLSNTGLKVYDNQGHLVSTFGESIVFDSSRPQYIGGENAFIIFADTDSDTVPDTITIGGNVIMSGSNKTLSQTLNELNANAEGALTYDHEYKLDSEKTIATFTAHVYRGGVDVTSEFNEEQFTWYYKTEDNVDPQPINRGVNNNNYGKTMTILIADMGYGGEIVGRFTTGSTQRLLRSNGDTLTDAASRNLLAQTSATGNEVRVRDLTYTTTLYPTDGILIIQSEEERLATIASLADAIWAKYGITIEDEPLLQGNNVYEDIGLGRITNSEIEALTI